MAFLTGLFLAIGYAIGGQGGMVMAFLFAAGTNLFAYWNSDKMVLSMYGAREVDENSAPEFVHLVRTLSQNAGLPMQPARNDVGPGIASVSKAIASGLTNPIVSPMYFMFTPKATLSVIWREKFKTSARS